jgi:hypothetical protein
MATDRTRINQITRRLLDEGSQISPEAAERINAYMKQAVANNPARQFVIEEPEDPPVIAVFDFTPTDD